MILKIKNLFLYLDKRQQKKFIILQIIVVLNSIIEILGVTSILPFVSIVSSKNLIFENEVFLKIYSLLNFSNVDNFILFTGISVFLILLISTVSSIITTVLLANFAHKISAEVSNRLFEYYISQNWNYHLNTSTSLIINNLHQECSRVTGGILDSSMQMISRIFFSIPMCIGIFLVNPLVACVGLLTFLCAYFLIYKTIRKKAYENGKILSTRSQEKYKIIYEAIGGIKNVILSNSSLYFIKKFSTRSFDLAKSSAMNTNLVRIPKFLVEFISFGLVIILLTLLNFSSNNNFQDIIPQIAFFAFAGYKLIPSFQQIYMNITSIKTNISALDSIENDLKKSTEKKKSEHEVVKNFEKFKTINLKNINFSFKEKEREEFQISNLNLQISSNSVVGIAGQSGSGKSTVVNLILGLLTPNSGTISVDEENLDNKNIKSWQKNIGYVPQSIFLSDTTLAENIAFGIDQKNIDIKKVHQAIDLAELSNFVNAMPERINTKIGERGVKLSGGQQQRVGIARALYHNPNILIFDEATSSLDENTEKNIMNAINKFYRLKTIIIVAHRINTLKKCDNIFLFEKGRVIETGSFKKLFEIKKR